MLARRPLRKKIHYSMHFLALFCACFGVLAAFQSHNLKLPTPLPNLYSPHSFLGMTTVCLLVLQVGGEGSTC
jgi:cytochrome b-561